MKFAVNLWLEILRMEIALLVIDFKIDCYKNIYEIGVKNRY